MADDKKTTTTKKDKDKPASGVLDSIGDWIADHPTLVGSLLGGGLGATAGYTMPSAEDESMPDEEKFQSRLKRALLFGGIGAGGGALLGTGLHQLSTSVPADRKSPEQIASDTGEGASTVGKVLTHPIAGAAYGLTGGLVGAHHGNKLLGRITGSPVFGMNEEGKSFVNSARKDLGMKEFDRKVSTMEYQNSMSDLANMMENKRLTGKERAKLKSRISNFGGGTGEVAYRSGLKKMKLMGKHPGRVGAKLGVGAATSVGTALLMDYLFGTTDEEKEAEENSEE